MPVMKGWNGMNEIDKTVLERFKSLLLKSVDLHKMILFGSRARGDADPHSDMDVVVILNGMIDDEVRDFISDCAWEAGFVHGIVLVPVVFTRDEWDNSPERSSPFVKTVETEGVTL
jgi:predicted nucleotidyltransferase